MLTLKFNLRHQNITLVNKAEIVASDSKNYLQAHFNLLSDDWDSSITAIFKSDNIGTYTVLLDDDNNCLVPWELLKPNAVITVSAFCDNLHTAVTASFKVAESGYTGGETPSEPTPTVYEQILKGLDSKQNKLIAGEGIKIEENVISAVGAKSAYEIALEHGFIGSEDEWLASLKGEKGEQGEQGIQGTQGIQGEKGERGEKGQDGADGKTPVKGVDYFTAEDKTEFTAEVTESLKPELAKKQDKLTAGSITTDNIASKAVTTEKLAEDVTNQLSKLKDDIGDRNITLDFNYDGYIDKKGKLSTLVAFKTTDFIAISSRVIVKGEFRDLNSPLYYINCYDPNKNYLGGTINAISSGNKIVNVNGVVTLIEGTCFIRVTNSPKSISMVKMWYSLSDTGDLSLVNQKIEESKTNNSIYSNIINDGLGFSVFSKFASVGDSLSVGYNTEKDGTPISEDLKHSWGAYIEKRCGTKSFWTGKSGQTCKTWLNTTSETWGLNYCKSIGTMPLYVICMGANEPGINIGTTDDIDTDNDTLYGYVSKVINELRNISPKSYIVCTGVSREQQNSLKINDVYKTVCELKEKCYYLDCFKEFNSEPFTSYFFNWHYSANGYSAMANLFDYKLKEVMAKNVEDFKYVNEADN